MMNRREHLMVVGCALLCLVGAGCAFFRSRPDSAEQAAVIELAKAGAIQGCVALGKSLKAEERTRLAQSLATVSATLKQSSVEDLANALRAIDPAVAPYASAIAGLAFIELTRVPVAARESALYQIIRGVVESCAAGVGMTSVYLRQSLVGGGYVWYPATMAAAADAGNSTAAVTAIDFDLVDQPEDVE